MSSVLPVVVAELELRDIEREIFRADLVEGADNATLNERPEALDGFGVNRTNDVLADGVINDSVRVFLIKPVITDPLVGAEQANLGRARRNAAYRL